MASLTTRLKLRKPATTDTVNVDTDLSGNFDLIDAAIGTTVCTSGTRPGTPFTGQTIFETDTKKTYIWNGTIWVPILTDYTPPSSAYALRNILHNGDMRVAQRGTTGAGATAATIAARNGIDRWPANRSTNAAGLTWTQTVKNSGSQRNGLRIQRDSGNASTATCQTYQQIESIDAVRLQSKIITLSFTAKCGANYSAASSLLNVVVSTGTVADENGMAALFTGNASPISTTVTLTTSDQRFTITSAAACGASILEALVQFTMTPVGTAGANDWFEVTDVQIEEGPVATPFERRPYALELATCYRYFYRDNITAGINGSGPVGFWTTTVDCQFPITPPVPMRTTPAGSASGSAAVRVFNASGGPLAGTAISITPISNYHAVMNITVASGGVAGNATQFSFSTTVDYIQLIADL